MIKDEMHVLNATDQRSGIELTIAFDNLQDCMEFIKFYNRPLEVDWIEPVYSFGMDPIFEHRRRSYEEESLSK